MFGTLGINNAACDIGIVKYSSIFQVNALALIHGQVIPGISSQAQREQRNSNVGKRKNDIAVFAVFTSTSGSIESIHSFM